MTLHTCIPCKWLFGSLLLPRLFPHELGGEPGLKLVSYFGAVVHCTYINIFLYHAMLVTSKAPSHLNNY